MFRKSKQQVAFETTCVVRDAFWAAIGAVDSDVIGHIINPAFMGRPAWPGLRQAYRVVRREPNLLIATDGLADPDEEAAENGFGIEVFIETPDIEPGFAGEPGDVSRLPRSWAFAVLEHIADNVADRGGINDMLDRYGVISMELPGVGKDGPIRDQLPRSFITADNSVGLLIGGPPADFPAEIPGMPLSPVRAAPVVVITAAELEALRKGGRTSRDALVAALAASPHGHRSVLTRGSMTGFE